MKKFFSFIWWIILIIIIVGAIVLGSLGMFKDIWDIILNIGGGSWVKGLIYLPFATIGIIQVIRGFFAVIEKDLHTEIPYDNLPRKSKIKALIYWIVTIISYVILFIVI